MQAVVTYAAWVDWALDAGQDLLMEVQSASTQNLDYPALATVLVEAAKSGDDAIRLTALRWLRSFVVDAKAELLPLYAIILQAILPALSSSTPEIQQVRIFGVNNNRQTSKSSLVKADAGGQDLHILRSGSLPLDLHL